MDSVVARFEDFVLAHFIDPQHHSKEQLESIITDFEPGTLWHSRALVVKQTIITTHENTKTFSHTSTKDAPQFTGLSSLTSDERSGVLDFYAHFSEGDNPLALVEAARAAAVFEESDLLLEYLQRSQAVLNFEPRITGVPVRYGPHQTKPVLRLAAEIESSHSSRDPSNGDAQSPHALENIPLPETNARFAIPQLVDETAQSSSAGALTNVESLLLLLRATHYQQTNANATSVQNEQVLPWVRRVTESMNFGSLNCGVQKQALFDRSVLEMKDIEELERGTVQLQRLGDALNTQQTHSESMRYFHQLLPLSWRSVDELAARRLVAMSDFGNAVSIYRRLGKPYDLAVALAALEQNDEAVRVLEEEVFPPTGRSMMLRADLLGSRELWQQAWDEFREPRAQLRLSRVALAESNLDQALTHLDLLLSEAATDHEALLLAGQTALSLRQWSRAAVYLRRAVAQVDDDPSAWSNLATALVQSGQPEPALHAIKQAIRVNQNPEPHLPTLANFISLSAQLNQWDEAVVGLMKLGGAAERGGAQFVAMVSPVFPKLVAYYTQQDWHAEGMQNFALDLFTDRLPNVISPDDPMLLRLQGKLLIWAERYSEGLKSSVAAVDSVVAGGIDDARARARLELYSAEAIAALEKYSDKPGRIDGSTAFPGWKAKQLELEQTVKRYA